MEIKVFKEYEDKIEIKIYEVIVDLTEEAVTEIKEHPETLVPRESPFRRACVHTRRGR